MFQHQRKTAAQVQMFPGDTGRRGLLGEEGRVSTAIGRNAPF